MKCIHCGTENNLKDRTENQGRCKKCNHPFVFEPTAMISVKITDAFFANALKDISVNGTLFFTKKQLFYLLERRSKKKLSLSPRFFFLSYVIFTFFLTNFLPNFLLSYFNDQWSFSISYLLSQLLSFIYLLDYKKFFKLDYAGRKLLAKIFKIFGFIVLVMGSYMSLFIVPFFPLFASVLMLGLLSIYLGYQQESQIGLPQELVINKREFQDGLNRWKDINGTYPRLLPSPQQSLKPTTVNPDITNYSFDRLIVCDTPEIAQFLIANNFHFEHNCAIFSITGYPQNIFQTTMQMLRQNPDLQVYALHSCTPKGMTLVHHLRTSQSWFLDTNQAIVDLGITLRQVLENERRMLIESSPNSGKDCIELPREVRGSLSPEELKWLDAGNFVELESFNPQQLIQIIQRGITRDLSLDSGDSDSIFVENSDSSLYVFQSFG
jgi:hypothetical protein